MAENPYQSSNVRSESPEDQPRFRISAVLLGVLADTLSGLAAGMVLGIAFAAYQIMQGENPAAMDEQLETSPIIVYGGLVIGCLGTVFGGYVAALVGKVWPYKHALLTGIGSMLLGLGIALVFAMDLATIQSIVWFVLAIPLALLGAYIYTLQRGPLPPDPRDVI